MLLVRLFLTIAQEKAVSRHFADVSIPISAIIANRGRYVFASLVVHWWSVCQNFPRLLTPLQLKCTRELPRCGNCRSWTGECVYSRHGRIRRRPRSKLVAFICQYALYLSEDAIELLKYLQTRLLQPLLRRPCPKPLQPSPRHRTRHLRRPPLDRTQQMVTSKMSPIRRNFSKMIAARLSTSVHLRRHHFFLKPMQM
jgi:hypothetical protein